MTLGHLVDGLSRRGHRITVIRPRQRQESPRYSVTQRVGCRQVRLAGAPIPGYPQLRLGLPAGRRMRQLWSLNRPDLVHAATEGLASGLAVGAFDYAAAHEFVQPGRNGLLAPLGDEAAFMALAVQLATQPALRARLAGAASPTHSWDFVIDRFETDLLEAISDHHREPGTTSSSESKVSNLKFQITQRP